MQIHTREQTRLQTMFHIDNLGYLFCAPCAGNRPVEPLDAGQVTPLEFCDACGLEVRSFPHSRIVETITTEYFQCRIF